MKVLCVEKPKSILIKDIDKPTLIDNHAIIKMKSCGICGSDITAYLGSNPTMTYPMIGLGHEGCGIVEDIGENDKGIKIGDKVVLEPYVSCGQCHMCKEGRYNNCVDIRVCGVHKSGMMSEYFLHPINFIHKIPDSIDFARATTIEPLAIALHGTSRAKVKSSDYCVIFGAGIIGLYCAFACLEKGATPILIDVLDKRLDRAKSLGIEYVFNSSNGDIVEYLKKVTNDKLPEAMIDCSGNHSVLQQMHNYVCHGATIALVGWAHDCVSINTIMLTRKEIDVCPSRNSSNKFEQSIKMIEEMKLPFDKTITKVINLDDVQSVIEDMIDNPSDYMKVVVSI